MDDDQNAEPIVRSARPPGEDSQNARDHKIAAAYSVRGVPTATVSTPITWDEVAACASPEDLVFTSDDVLARVEAHGDLFAPLLS